MNDSVHLGFAVDKGYLKHLATLLVSISDNTQRHIVAHVAISDISEADKQAFQDGLPAQIALAWYSIAPSLNNQGQVSTRYAERLNQTTYYRFVLPNIIPRTISKLLYLDSDMLALADVGEIYDYPLKSLLGAVEDTSLCRQSRWSELGYANPVYVNAGLLLIDCNGWRERGISERLLSHLNCDKQYDYNDQDILNIELNKEVTLLSNEWNCQTALIRTNYAQIKPKVLHFTGVEKPWHISSEHEYKEAYWAYRAQTPYQGKPELALTSHDQALLKRISIALLQSGKKLLIFGAGQQGRKIAEAIKVNLPEHEVIGFVDSYERGTRMGLPCHSLTELGTMEFDAIVLGSVAFKDEMISVLTEAGIAPATVIA